MQTVIDTHLFCFEFEAWAVRRHGVTMAMLLLAVVALPGIDAGIIDSATLTTGVIDLTHRHERVLSAYTPLTDSNIKNAIQLWIAKDASAPITYGPIETWDLSSVTSLATGSSFYLLSCALTVNVIGLLFEVF
jgi:hypothetical protein